IKLDLLKRLRALEPQKSEWLEWQAAVYATAVRFSLADGIPRVRTLSGADNNSHLPFTLPLVESQLLKTELESSSDVALLGSTAQALLREIARLKSGFAADPEIEASEAFAKQMQIRVQELKSR